MSERFDLVHQLLDMQLVDCDGVRCGRVDDVELQHDPPRVTALLVGEGLYPRRLPSWLRGWARRRVGPERWGANAMRVPWEAVADVGAWVELRPKADELGLANGDDPDNWIVSRLPWN